MASKRRLRRKSCTGKVRYLTQDQALAALKRFTRHCEVWHGYMTPYRCAFCHGFHFGHPPKHVREALGGRFA